MEAKRKTEAEQVYDAGTPQLASRVVKVSQPITGQANISSDGGKAGKRSK